MPEHKPNQLINEKSPYLLQHAYNPVNWHPWSEESFAKARKEDKPIFLSIGYSTCYWCHVMEREVFENEKLAKIMNELFINIKVDREERPDVDRVYMSALQSLTGSGGWPMSMFLTNELKPFYGATYVPPEEKYGQPGFLDLITGINDAWKNRRNEITKAGNELTEYLKKITSGKKEKSELNESILTKGYENYIQTFDEVYGGFGKAPKFPRPVAFNFLLRYYNRHRTQTALDMVSYTLEKMAKGGDYDHFGGGFHRYSVDKFWRVPHFEKMLYDQAQLVISFLETYQITNDEFFANYAKDILSYVNRCLTDKPTGGFYSAEDAESALSFDDPHEKEEGAFYVWEKKEIEDLLDKEDTEIISYYFGIGDEGNTPIGSDPHSVFINKNILYIAHSISETANHFGKSTDEVYTIIEESKRILFDAREKRPLCHLDDKVLLSWNALMISAYAKAYQVFYKTEYLESAKLSADFILSKLYDESNQTLKHRYRDGDSRFEGTLEDYSYFIQSLLDLYESDFDEKYLGIAVKLAYKMLELFYDKEYNGFFDISENDKSILIRTKEDYDSAEPTGNSIAILNLLRLSQITENKGYYAQAEKSLEYFSSQMSQHPYGMPQMLVALDYYLHKPKQIVIAGTDNNSIQEFAAEVHKRFIPNKVLIGVNKNSGYKHSGFISSLAKDIKQTTAFVCENYTCKLPVKDITEFTKQLK